VSPYNEGVGFRFNREKMLARIPGVSMVWKNKVRKKGDLDRNWGRKERFG